MYNVLPTAEKELACAEQIFTGDQFIYLLQAPLHRGSVRNRLRQKQLFSNQGKKLVSNHHGAKRKSSSSSMFNYPQHLPACLSPLFVPGIGSWY
jgi:hypothetical protein